MLAFIFNCNTGTFEKVRVTLLSQVEQAGRLASEYLLQTCSMSVRSKFLLSKELSKICTGRCPVLQGSDTERQGIQCVPNPKQTCFGDVYATRKGCQQSKKDTPVSVLFALLTSYEESNPSSKCSSILNRVRIFG